jgi:ankyrin repeat protein
MTRRVSSWLAAVLVVMAVVVGRGQTAGDTPLVTAARGGDLAGVQALLAKRVDVNAPSKDGSTALLWAVYNGNLEMVRALVAAQAKVDTPNRFGVTPLLQASRTGDAAIIAALLKAGASASLTHPDGETALMAASRSGHLDAVRLLVEAGADLNAADTFQEQTALMWAASEGHADVVAALLGAGADPNRLARVTGLKKREHADHPTGGLTALMFAVRSGHEDIARALIKAGADPKATNGDNATATIIAIVNDRFDLAKTLLDLGADPNDGSLYFAVDMHDATSDMRARDGSRLRAIHENTLTSLDLVKLLIDRGADPNKPFIGQLHSTSLCCGDDVNASPFYRAAIASDVEVIKVMLAHGAQVEWAPKEVKKEGDSGSGGGGGGRGANANVGKTPLMMAMVGGRGAPFGGGPGFNRTGPPPFREAADRAPVEAVKTLLAAGADPNVKAPDGSTPLHQAVQARQVAIIRALVGAGAKLDSVNKDNLTPLLLAEKPESNGRGNAAVMDQDAYRPPQNTKQEVIAALRELMKLGPDDPAPVPPPLPEPEKKEEKKAEEGANQ